MNRPDALACAHWLQAVLGAFVFPVDHPGLPECAGAHRPGQPCDGTRGKHPACGHWSRDSTADPAVIAAALSRGLRNLGIDCARSGLLVVDEDRSGAFTGYAADIGREVPPTFTVATSKGAHFYFRQLADEPLGNGRGALAGRGIDIRGGGGFVVAPGSIHQTGALYAPVDPMVPAAPAPDWLIRALRSVPRSAARSSGTEPGCGSAYGRLRGALSVLLDAKPGERNECLYWSACRAAEMVTARQVDQEAAVAVLSQAAETVGLGAGEVQATIASAFRRVMA